jgi:hypothetical protein
MLRAIHPMHLLLAVTLAVAAMLMASTGAYAHAGHDHGQPQATRSTAQQSTGFARAAEATLAAVEKAAQVRPAAASAGKSEMQQTYKVCLGGCCQPGGTGCCVAWLAPFAGLAVPIRLRSAVDPRASGTAGVKPDALPEPPNTLA